MGLIQRIFGKREKRNTSYDLKGLSEFFQAYRSDNISEATALGISALKCGVQAISEGVGSLPCITYRKLASGGREKDEQHPVFSVLHDEPNEDMTAPVFWETLQSHALLYGGGFAEIVREFEGGPVTALIPIHPTLITPKRNELGKLVYAIEGKEDPLLPYEVFHVPGLSPDGTVGYRLIEIARTTLSMSDNATRFGNAWFKNASRPSGVLEHPGQLGDAAYETLMKHFNISSGVDNAGKINILEEGMKWTSIQATNEQSQYQELLRFMVFEVARLLNITPSKLHSLEKSSFASLEAQNQDFLTTTLRPWLVKWEAEIRRKLFLPSERGQLYAEFLTDSLLRADINQRYAAYQIGLMNGFLNVNTVCAKEGLPEVPGGDLYYKPLNQGVTNGNSLSQPTSGITLNNNGSKGQSAGGNSSPIQLTNNNT